MGERTMEVWVCGSEGLLSAHGIKKSLIEESTSELDGNCKITRRM